MLERPLGRTALAGLLLAVMAGLLVASSLHKKLAYDEYDNLAYGYRVRTLGPLPPLNGQRMPILVLNALGCPEPCREADVNASEGRRLLVRLPTMAFALGLGIFLYVWAGEWVGPRGALLALALYALHPSFLAHGKQVTSDVQAAFFTVAAAYPVWRIFRGRGDPRILLATAALATAGAFVSKYTSVLVVPMLALLWLVERRGRITRRACRAAAAYLALVVLFLNAAYLFQGTLRRADEYNWKSRRLQVLRHVPVPLFLPRTFLLGLDFSYHVQEQPDVGRGPNYVLGRLNTDGVWYAFPLMVLLKTPLGFFGLLVLAARARPPGTSGAAWVWVPFALFLAFFSLLVAPQIGIRYLLPGLAFLFLGVGWATAGDRRLVAVLFAWAVGLRALVPPALHVLLQRARPSAAQRLPLPRRLEPGLGGPLARHRPLCRRPSRPTAGRGAGNAAGGVGARGGKQARGDLRAGEVPLAARELRARRSHRLQLPALPHLPGAPAGGRRAVRDGRAQRRRSPITARPTTARRPPAITGRADHEISTVCVPAGTRTPTRCPSARTGSAGAPSTRARQAEKNVRDQTRTPPPARRDAHAQPVGSLPQRLDSRGCYRPGRLAGPGQYHLTRRVEAGTAHGDRTVSGSDGRRCTRVAKRTEGWAPSTA